MTQTPSPDMTPPMRTSKSAADITTHHTKQYFYMHLEQIGP